MRRQMAAALAMTLTSVVKGFDHHISLVADALERRNDRFPVNVIIGRVSTRSLPQA